MLFGSELFESIIGELQSATTVKVIDFISCIMMLFHSVYCILISFIILDRLSNFTRYCLLIPCIFRTFLTYHTRQIPPFLPPSLSFSSSYHPSPFPPSLSFSPSLPQSTNTAPPPTLQNPNTKFLSNRDQQI